MIDNDKMKIVIVGHVDHGKSTLIGRLIYDTKSINGDKIREMLNEENNIEFAFLTDHFEEERDQGITIDTTQIFFRTVARNYAIIDAPGHSEFIVNMITGAAQASTAVLVVDSLEGIQEETKRHAYILSLLGMKRVVVALNKMDLVNYSQSVYKKLMEEMEKVMDRLGIYHRSYVPIVAKNGDNIAKKSNNMTWYHGDILLDLLDQIPIESTEDIGYGVFPIQGLFTEKYEDRIQRIILGRLECGTLQEGDNVCILPENKLSTIKKIHKFNEEPIRISKGECCGIEITNPLFVERGNVVSSLLNELVCSRIIKATIFWLNDIGGRSTDKYLLRCNTQEISCKIKYILQKMDSSTMEYIRINSDYISKFEVAQVIIEMKSDLVHSKISAVSSMARFVLLKDDDICAVGTIPENHEAVI